MKLSNIDFKQVARLGAALLVGVLLTLAGVALFGSSNKDCRQALVYADNLIELHNEGHGYSANAIGYAGSNDSYNLRAEAEKIDELTSSVGLAGAMYENAAEKCRK